MALVAGVGTDAAEVEEVAAVELSGTGSGLPGGHRLFPYTRLAKRTRP